MSGGKITIWGRLSALNVLKVIWAADETGVAYERIDAGRTFGVIDTPAYRELNPNGLVPTIEDDGYVLWESNTIVRYLCARYGGDLYPADICRRLHAERWMDWQSGQMFAAYRPAFNYYARGLTHLFSEVEARASFDAASALFAILDRHLSQTPYVAGDSFSMGDIPIGVIAHQWLELKRPLPALENVRRWHAHLAARAGAQQTFAVPVALLPGQRFP